MGYPPGAPRSFFVSAEEPRGQVEDGIECGKVTTRSRGSAGPDPSTAWYGCYIIVKLVL